jgi:hypothetical protein
VADSISEKVHKIRGKIQEDPKTHSKDYVPEFVVGDGGLADIVESLVLGELATCVKWVLEHDTSFWGTFEHGTLMAETTAFMELRGRNIPGTLGGLPRRTIDVSWSKQVPIRELLHRTIQGCEVDHEFAAEHKEINELIDKLETLMEKCR